MKNIDKIISESVKKTLIEMDIVPLDKNGDVNLTKNQTINAWRMIFNLMDNVKLAMKYEWEGKRGKISKNDVNRICNYINIQLNDILKYTIKQK